MKQNLFIILVLIISYSQVGNSQEITMFPGFWGTSYYQDANKIPCKKLESLMLEDAEANQLWQKSKKHETIAYVAVGLEIGFLIWQLNKGNNNESQTVPIIGVVASGLVAIGFSLSANSLKKKSILKYNANQDIGKVDLGVTYNGLGIVYSF